MSAELWAGFKLGDCLVRPEVNRIGETRIDAKSMEVLVALAEVSPAVVSGAALLDRVWPDVVVVDNVIHQAIKQLRKALHDDARAPRYIECIPRRGYRLIAAVASDAGRSRSTSDTPHNLPEELTSFVGRELELRELTELVMHCRLITLTGVGGCGKTRLALSVARSCVPNFVDGVWLVDLAPVTDATQVIRAIGKSLHIPDSKDRPINDAVVESLISARSLLVLDNCEHVVDACARLAEAVLHQSKELRILATSREGFGIGVERPWPVQPLAIPKDEDTVSVAELATIESVRLFFERATVVRPNFALNADNAGTVAEICKRLDGLPFAIELAAARMRDMSAEQIKLRLRDRFRLLAGGSRTALPRQRTLQATLDWSHQLLREPERKLLRRLAVFAGDFSVDAAIAIAERSDESEQTFDALTRLVDQSMLQVDPATGRYRMLETVRQYADDHLGVSGEARLIRERHMNHYLAVAERLSQDVESRNWQSDVFKRFLADQDNFEGALGWCLETDVDLGIQLARRLAWFWVRLTHFSALHWFEDILTKAPDSFPERGEVLCRAALFHLANGDLTRAVTYFQDALKEARGGPACSEAVVTIALAYALLRNGEVEKSKALLNEALLIADGTDPRTRALLLVDATDALMWIRFDDARANLEESIQVLRCVDDQEGLSRALTISGNLDTIGADFDRGRAKVTEALALAETMGDQRLASINLVNLSLMAEVAGDYAEAVRLMEATEKARLGMLDLERRLLRAHLGRQLWKSGQRERGIETLRNVLGIARTSVAHIRGDFSSAFGLAALHAMANVACDLGDHVRAARLYGAAKNAREEVGIPIDAACGPLFDWVADVLVASLGAKTYEREKAAGAAMTYHQAIDFALTEDVVSLESSATLRRVSHTQVARSVGRNSTH